MEISDVRVRLVRESTDRLKAVCSVTLDEEFVVRDVKIVEGTHGLFVAMPSRKLSSPCPRCKTQNQLRAKFCNECGSKLPPARIPADADGREKAHRDIAHPITATFRKTIQDRVLESYRAECEKDENAGNAGNAGNAENAENAGYSESAVETSLDAEEQLGEYDALIADLNDSGSHEVVRDDRAAPPRRDEPAAESDRGQQRRGRGRRHHRGGGERQPTEAAGGERGAAPRTDRATDRESVGGRAVSGSTGEEAKTPGVTAPVERRREPSPAEPSVGAETGPRQESGESREEESPFGAGLV